MSRLSRATASFMLQSLCLFTNWLCKNWKKFLVDVTLVKCCWQPSSYPQLLSLNLFPVLTRCASKIHLYSISILVILHLLSSQPPRCSRRHFPLPPHMVLIFILSNSLSNSYPQRLITAIMRLRDCWLQRNFLLIPLLTSQLSLLMLPLVLIFTPFLQLLNHLPDPVLSTSNFTTASTFLLFCSSLSPLPVYFQVYRVPHWITQCLKVTLAVPPLQPQPSCHLQRV